MDFSNILRYDTGIVLEDIRNFGLKETLDNGSTFRWKQITPFRFLGVVNGKVLQVFKYGNNLGIDNITVEEFKEYYYNYFGFNIDYDYAYSVLRKDSVISSLLPVENNLRLVRQDFIESFVSAVISQNNNISRIKKIIENLCYNYGNRLIYRNVDFYEFPTLEQLSFITVEEWQELGVGYRALGLKTGVDTLVRIQAEYGDLNEYISSLSYVDLYNKLLGFHQIGPKVANFIITMTGSCRNYQDSFVIDVWIKRALQELYNIHPFSGEYFENWKSNKFGGYSALAQQILFYYYRSR